MAKKRTEGKAGSQVNSKANSQATKKANSQANTKTDSPKNKKASGGAAGAKSADSDHAAPDSATPDPSEAFAELSRTAMEIFAQQAGAANEILERSQRLVTESMSPVQAEVDPLNVGPSFRAAGEKMAMDPGKFVAANYELWKQHAELWSSMAPKVMQGEQIKDKRFRDESWEEQPLFDLVRRTYLITSGWLVDTMGSIEGLEPADREKLVFHTKLLADAFAPSNFLMTNPAVMERMRETGGESLVQGMKNLQRDLDPTTGELKILMNDPDAFTLGESIATAPGKVVWQNDLVQLIQYAPTTEQVHKRPLVIVPPWINKFYILDLQPKNSFIRWAVDAGYTVFVLSWVNPDGALGDKTFEDYMQEGILDSLDAVQQACGVKTVSMIGYCIGGTLLSATLAYMAAKGDKRVKAATFFASQADFEEAGDLKLFADDVQVDHLEQRMKETGYLEGSAMATTFNLLRANDLIWSFYVDNYLMGKEPMKFDLLYWNSDATRMPRETHLFYLRRMYIDNALSKPGGISLKGVPIDLSKVSIPIYLQAAVDDHIAPCRSVFKSTGLYSGDVRFMLAGSGHIAGVINPPAANKYQYWTNEDAPLDFEEWRAGATEHPGSWWQDWDGWLAPQSGKKVAARQPGDGELEPIEDAPGSYVKVKS